MSFSDLRAKTFAGLRWTLIARPTAEVATALSMVALARLITPAEFGRYAVASIVASLAMIPGAGIGPALIQRQHITREHLQAGLALSLLAGLIIVALALGAASLIIVPVFGHRTAELVRLTTLQCFVLAVSGLSFALLQRRLEFRRMALIDVTSSVLTCTSSVAMAVAGLEAYALVLGALVGGVTAGLLAWIWAPPPLPRLPRRATQDILRYAAPASLAAVSWIGFANCDYAIVGARLGVLSTGLYFRAYNLAVEYQKKVSQILHTVGFPVLARTREDHEMDVVRSRMVSQMSLMLFPLLVMLAVVAPVFVPWFFGAAWTAAVVPTQILALGGASVLVIDAAGTALMAAGRPRALLIYGWGHFVTYALAVFLVAGLGLNAVAIAAAVVHTVFLFLAYVLLVRGSVRKALRSLWRDLAPATVSSLALASIAIPASLLLTTAHMQAVPYLAAMAVLAVVAYCLTLRKLFPDSLERLLSMMAHVLPRRVLAHRVRPESPVRAKSPALDS